mmetsp:Transcript_12042/g.43381  ORF Transcript_12042/g.43381 Transcript_12042/m.43381 type:complete len:117 (-) Transcript_12042:42-392(-)
MIVRITHDEDLYHGSKLLKETTNNTFIDASVETADKDLASGRRISCVSHISHVLTTISIGVLREPRNSSGEASTKAESRRAEPVDLGRGQIVFSRDLSLIRPEMTYEHRRVVIPVR